MKDATRVALVFASFCFFTSAVHAQASSAVTPQQPAALATPTFVCKMAFGPTTAGALAGPTAPYSAVQESSSVQTLADGTHITRKPTTEKVYRDAEGRLRTERSFCHGPNGTPTGTVVDIRDPVSGHWYVLDEQNQVAHRFVMQVRHPRESAAPPATIAPAQAASSAAVPAREPRGETVSTESLGTQRMEGVLAEGTRTTRIIPEGLEDNDRPITVLSEIWRSPELKIVLLSKTNDPRIGEMTTRLTNIALSNPILSLFQPPPDYKIVDETDRVTLTYTRP